MGQLQTTAVGRPRPEAKARWGGGKRVVAVVCDGCGSGYLDYRARVERASRHFCSAACYRANRSGLGNPKWRGGMARCICRNCGKEFQVVQAEAKNGRGRHCSVACKIASGRIYPDRRTAHREHGRRREARQRAGAAIRTHTYAEWQALLDRYRHRCANCRRKRRLTRDHIIPLSRGGHDGIENIQPLCHSCNAEKGDRLWFVC